MQKITPCLWFDANAEEAVGFYTSLFSDAGIGSKSYYGEDQYGQPGSVMTISFRLFGQEFIALNGGPGFRFNESVSFMVHCNDQEEIDRYWDALSAGGETSRCGWLKDRFGLSWQIVPKKLGEWMGDPARAEKVMKALMKMDKLDLATLERASSL